MAHTEQPSVLLVEDEPAQREVLAYNLEAEGFRVIQAENGEDAMLLVDEDTPDIIILDWMMPNLSGIEVCRRLKMRPETRGIPIILLSARAEEVDRIRGLETGADDYVIKPYSVLELMARARVQLRRVRPSSIGVVLEWGDLRLDPETHRVYRADKVLKLGPTEFRLLTTFMEKPSPGVEPRTTAGPGLGPRHLCRYPHGRCPHRPAAQGAVPVRRRRPPAHRARRRLRLGVTRPVARSQNHLTRVRPQAPADMLFPKYSSSSCSVST